MATPTITTTGATGGLLLIIDHEDVAHRIPKLSVSDVMNSSNSSTHRIEVVHANGNIVLLFGSASEVAAALTAFDSQY